MKINSKSWHWKFNKEYFNTLSDRKYTYRNIVSYDYFEERHLLGHFGNTLCSYFWKTIYRLFTTLITLLFIMIMSGCLTFLTITDPIFTLVTQIQQGNVMFDDSYYFWVILLVLTLVVGGFYLYYKSKEKLEDSLVVNYIKAHKSKYCPYIEVE